jgi:RNA polymerase sigma-54 factor
MTGIELGLTQRGALALTPSLRQAIGFLTLSNTELAARLADLQQANDALSLEVPGASGLRLDLIRQIASPPDGTGRKSMPHPSGPGGLDVSVLAAMAPGLIAHVEAQLPLLVREAADMPVARVLLYNLDPSGWLGASLEDIAAQAGCSIAQADSVLRQVQAAEPTGLFARSLSECLALQIREQGLMSPPFAALLEHLPLVAAGEIDVLARTCACSADAVTAMIQRLRRLDQKPGAAFAQGDASQPLADLFLRRDGRDWLLELNLASVPALRLTPGKDATPETLREARGIMQALERRHATVLAIGAEIVARQDAHLRGQAPLAALTINDLAAATGLHRSSVSRVTAALSLSLPRRTLGLRDLMSPAVPAARQLEDPPSVSAVLQRMREIVGAEDRANPLSDDALSRLLLPHGAALARRTVAKYRRLAGIPSRATRRRQA